MKTRLLHVFLALSTLACRMSTHAPADAANANEGGGQDTGVDRSADGPNDGPADAAAESPVDATGPDARSLPYIAPVREIPLLESPDPTRPMNHSREVTVAAVGGHVVIAAIHEHFAAAGTYDTTGFHKRVGMVVSHDRGGSFGAALDPGMGDQTTDPVVRAASDGSFWLTTWDTNSTPGACALATSANGDEWTCKVKDTVFSDKQWIAVDAPRRRVFVQATFGLGAYDFDGKRLGQDLTGGEMSVGGYTDDTGAHFLGVDYGILRWDGVTAPVVEVVLPARSVVFPANTCAGFGRTPDGGQWILRTVDTGAASRVVLRVRGSADEGTDIDVTPAGAVGFFPAAALDSSGRLHAIWYETGASVGVLKYARSVSSDLGKGFGPAVTIDPEALPGGGWLPTTDSETGGRRLREYVDVAVEGNRAQLVWTHAPGPPSRVSTTYVEFE